MYTYYTSSMFSTLASVGSWSAAVLPNMPEDLVDDFDFEAGL
jgi:hypothetical protein